MKVLLLFSALIAVGSALYTYGDYDGGFDNGFGGLGGGIGGSHIDRDFVDGGFDDLGFLGDRRSFRPRFSSLGRGFFGPGRFGPFVGATSIAVAGARGIGVGAFAGAGGGFGGFLPFPKFPFRRPSKPFYYPRKY